MLENLLDQIPCNDDMDHEASARHSVCETCSYIPKMNIREHGNNLAQWGVPKLTAANWEPGFEWKTLSSGPGHGRP